MDRHSAAKAILRYACIPVFSVLMMFVMVGCDRHEPIRIGYVGSLTGRHAKLGISGRNGVMFAVEEINRSGGINGRPVKLITRDDKQDPRVARQVDTELIREGAVAIIGHMTSAMTREVIPLINKEKILLISPTASTDALTGIEDYFFRATVTNKLQTVRLATYAYNTGMRRIAVIYDLSNQEYTDRFSSNFQSEFESRGGRVVHRMSYISNRDILYSELAGPLANSGADGILIVANGYDTAMITQHLRKQGASMGVIASGWAMTEDLLRHGGKAVENIIFCNAFDSKNKSRRFIEFKQAFSDRFGSPPNFAALRAYEASRILFEAISIARDASQLRQAIVRQGSFPGVLWNIRIDRYGDAHTGLFLIKVIDGRFRVIDTWEGTR